MRIRRILGALLTACVLIGAGYAALRYRAWKHRALLEEAEGLRRQERWPEMEKTLQRALRFGGRDDAWRSLSQALIQLGRIEESLAAAKKSVRRGPENAWNRIQLAEAALLAGDLELVDRTVKDGLRSAPDPAVRQALEDLRRRSSTHVFELTWSFKTAELGPEGDRVVIGLPTLATPFQTADVSFQGAALMEKFLLGGSWAARLNAGGAERFELETKVRVQPGSFRPKMRLAAEAPPADMDKYLGANAHMDPQGPLARRIAEGCRRASAQATVDCLNLWFRDHMKWAVSPGPSTSEELLRRGDGNCMDLARAFTVISRAAGVPAREVRGVWVSPSDGKVNGHSWAEVHLPGPGWVPLEPGDLSSLGRVDAIRIRLFHYGFEGDQPLFALNGNEVADARVRLVKGGPVEESTGLFRRLKGFLFQDGETD